MRTACLLRRYFEHDFQTTRSYPANEVNFGISRKFNPKLCLNRLAHEAGTHTAGHQHDRMTPKYCHTTTTLGGDLHGRYRAPAT